MTRARRMASVSSAGAQRVIEAISPANAETATKGGMRTNHSHAGSHQGMRIGP